MNVKVVSLQQLSDAQIVELAKLHQAILHSLLSDLGLPFLEKYYRIVCAEQNVIGFCALSETDRPLGWVIGSPKPDQLNKGLQQPFLWFFLQMLRVAITRPLLLWQLVVSARTASMELAQDQIELTYLGVAPSTRRMGLGRKLIDEFVQACRTKYRSVILSVEVENEEAIQLYTLFGFQILDTLAEGKFQRHRMKLQLYRLSDTELNS